MNDMEALTNDIASEITTQAGALQKAWSHLQQAVPLSKVISAAVLLLVCLLISKLIVGTVSRILRHSHLEKSLHSFLRSVLKALLAFLTLMLVASTLGIDTSSLLAVLSVAGLAVSLSIQNSLSNLASGVMLLMSHPFKVDDYIQAGSVEGTVREIGITYTKLLTADSRTVYIPNSTVTASSIVNYTAQGRRRIDLEFSASYDSPVSDVKAALEEAVAIPQVEKSQQEIYVKAYGDSAITYLIRVWTATQDYWPAYFTIMENVKSSFDRRGIEMTYPHLNVHMCQ